MKTFLHLAWRNLGLIIGFALIAAFCSQQFLGFMMILVTPPALLVGLVWLGLGWRVAEKRAHYLFSISVVLLATAVVGGVHVYRHLSARAEADQLARRVLDFKEKKGRFPSNVTELGEPALTSKSIYMLHYGFDDGKPALFYFATFVIFETWQYDFASQTWSYNFD
jgi:hypothetical protein